MLGGHIPAVFKLVTVIFIICVTITLVSFREIPLHILDFNACPNNPDEIVEERGFVTHGKSTNPTSYGTLTNEELMVFYSSQIRTEFLFNIVAHCNIKDGYIQ